MRLSPWANASVVTRKLWKMPSFARLGHQGLEQAAHGRILIVIDDQVTVVLNVALRDQSRGVNVIQISSATSASRSW
jgi:hypothetical protein